MGENVLLGQVKSFKKGADRSLEQMSAPRLFDRTELVATTYTARPTNGSDNQPGQTLLGHVSADGKRINLAEGHRIVATIEGDGARALIDALREPDSPGVTPMEVIEVSQISGFLKTTVVKTD